ncbi:MAG: DoxX family protein [Pseudomonadota bacterium]|nr:DoxX family protein [Pseudomonadota bacterium]
MPARTPPARTVAYWTTTGLLALAMTAGGVMDVTQAPDIVAGIVHLGYPAHLATILGAWKLLGVAALLAPGLPRLKEWAYAGFLFNLTGAAISHAISGDPVANVVTPLVLLTLALASWATRPEGRRLGDVLPTSARDMAAA